MEISRSWREILTSYILHINGVYYMDDVWWGGGGGLYCSAILFAEPVSRFIRRENNDVEVRLLFCFDLDLRWTEVMFNMMYPL